MSLSYNERVAGEVKLKDIVDIAKGAGVSSKDLKLFGKYIAKVDANLLDDKLKKRKDGQLILVTSITPTRMGEGKTVTTIGLSMALNKLGKKSISCISQPSLGPTFSVKGVGTGGGYAQVLPAEDINLDIAGDTYAVQNAQNLCAAALDNSFFWGNSYKLQKERITWRRVSDVNDRALRNMTIGGGGKLHGVSRKTGIDITAASECMAILALSRNLKDMRARLGKIVVGYSEDGKPVTAENLKCAGAMAVLLKQALNPNIVQTIEHTPCFIHGNPFANVSLGSSSVIADRMAIKLADYAVTEAGFGADLGAEKFFDIKCRQSGLKPDVVVINCSVRGLKMHSGDFTKKGSSLWEQLKKEDLSAVDRGCSNLEKQIENLKIFGVPIVVAINYFETDTKKELKVIIKRAEALEADGIAVSEAYKMGSSGTMELARAVVAASKIKPKFRYLYPVDMNLKNKIERISKSMYGASEIRYSPDALKDIELIEKAKLDQK
ncbi:MAG: formate--tetrahydrofolate ligase, partial [Candidatus Omnitrophica bacterium]|nr:formate--tetrahydrofolate ligase [Candidatus Omnitrophota bacterium]